MAHIAHRRGRPWLKSAPSALQKPSSHPRNNARQRQTKEKAAHDASLHEDTPRRDNVGVQSPQACTVARFFEQDLGHAST